MRSLELPLIYQDDALLVLDKPAGMLSVPGRGVDKQDCLSTRVQSKFSDALVVHRLDMATSGLIIMARGIGNQRLLSQAFEKRAVMKRYVAVVDGLVTPEATSSNDHPIWHTIDLPIALDWPHRPLRIIDGAHGKPSLTRWRLIGTETVARQLQSRLELEPLTGRSHQLRVHLKALGHAILGDTLYAHSDVQARSNRLLLHASRLEFKHPVTNQTLSFHAPTPF